MAMNRPLLLFAFIWWTLVTCCLCRISLNKEINTNKRFTIQFRSPLNDTQAIHQDRERFLRYLQAHHVINNIYIRYNYSDAFNGMSIELKNDLSATSLNQTTTATDFLAFTLSKCPYVHQYWPGKRYSRPNAIIEQNLMAWNKDVRFSKLDNDSFFNEKPLTIDEGLANLQFAHKMTTVDKAKEKGWTGKGIKVGILDTGIDYTHPALGGCFGEGCLVQYGEDLVGDGFGMNGHIKPDKDPLDQCDGHGTHVAGIVAANDTFKEFEGVAPGVTIGAWRIFGCNGDTDDDIIIAAADMAVKAGMDIINLSLGGGVSSWQEDALAVTLSNIAQKNITVVVAQGNEGRDGIARTPSPAIGKQVIAVGSIDNHKKLSPVIQIMNNNTQIITLDYIIAQGRKFVIDGPELPLISLSNNDYGCHTDFHQNLTGAIVMVKHGQCDYGQKALSVQRAGGIGILVYSNHSSIIAPPSMTIRPYRNSVRIPVASINDQSHRLIVNAYTSSHPLFLKFTTAMLDIKTRGKSSVFSTWGPDPELHFKPEISAIGGYVYSTFPVNMGAYAMLSGTSMATPYITGCIALLMHATGARDQKTILDSLVNYAKPIKKQPGLFESPAKQGSGLVQIYNSISGDQLMTPSTLALNDTMYFLNSTIINVKNRSNQPKLFQLTHMPAAAIQGYHFSTSAVPQLVPTYLISDAKVTFSQNSVRLNPDENINIQVQFTQPLSNETHLIYGGYLKVSSSDMNTNATHESHIPYFGALGNQRDLPILDTKTGYPFIGDSNGHILNTSLVYNFATTKRHWQPSSVLHLYTRLGSPTAIIKFELVSEQDQVIGQLWDGQSHYVSRNDHSNDLYDYALDWSGRILDNRNKSNVAPNGSFRIRAKALKIFGHPDRIDDWETWLSPSFRINRI